MQISIFIYQKISQILWESSCRPLYKRDHGKNCPQYQSNIHIYIFAHFLILEKIFKNLIWASELKVSTNTARETGLTQYPKKHMWYQQDMCNYHKIISLLIVVPL